MSFSQRFFSAVISRYPGVIVYYLYFLKLGPNVYVGAGVTIYPGARVKEAIILDRAEIQVGVILDRAEI